jgi:hypothetical protein
MIGVESEVVLEPMALNNYSMIHWWILLSMSNADLTQPGVLTPT